MVDLITLTRREVKNFLRIWKQTILPPVITIILYIIIFWKFIWEKIDIIEWVQYINFIFPWLLMMAVIMWSYSLTSFWFFSSKMFKNIEELIVSWMNNNKIIIWYVIAWILRWTTVWTAVFLVSLFLVNIEIYNLFLLFTFILLTSTLFSLAWLLNWIFAKSFDDVNIIPSFVITPLIYLWWVFYSIEMLSSSWQFISKLNPILYMINWLRYSFIWVSDINIYYWIMMLIIFIFILYILVIKLLKNWYWIKS